MFNNFKSTVQAATYQAVAFPCCLRQVTGYVSGTQNTQYFIHVFNSLTVTGSAIQVLQVIGANGFQFNFSPQELQCSTGLYFALSSTDETYTAVADGAKSTFEGTVDDVYERGTTKVGDRTTAVKQLDVWIDDEANSLYRLYVKNLSAGTRYFMLFAKDAPVNGSKPVEQWKVLTGGTLELHFGQSGFKPGNKPTNNAAMLLGCTVACSSTTGTLTLVVADDANIEAYII